MNIPKFEDKIKLFSWDKAQEKSLIDLVQFQTSIFQSNIKEIMPLYGLKPEDYFLNPKGHYIRLENHNQFKLPTSTVLFISFKTNNNLAYDLNEVQLQTMPRIQDVQEGKQNLKQCSEALMLFSKIIKVLADPVFLNLYIEEWNSFRKVEANLIAFNKQIQANKSQVELFEKGRKFTEELKNSGFVSMEDIVDYVESLDGVGINMIQQKFSIFQLPIDLKEKKKMILNLICE